MELDDRNLQVLPGARIPADGTVQAGQSHVDESMLTGEALPVSRKRGDLVIGGTMNMGGMLQVRALLRHPNVLPKCPRLLGAAIPQLPATWTSWILGFITRLNDAYTPAISTAAHGEGVPSRPQL